MSLSRTHAQTASTQSKSSIHHQEKLGPFLCWAVVFADIGTSIYYVPGILYGTVGSLAGFFVLLTMIVFILLTFKYVEVTYRFPQGGGVVTVAAKALNRWFGALGGMFILVDYFLTAAISCLSGILYLSVVMPAIGPQNTLLGFSISVWITIAILILLGLLNWFGVSESAKVSMVAAGIAFCSDIAILISVFTHITLAQFFALIPQMFSGRTLTLVTILTGFAGSFLAFSGLESISQLSPVMKLPRRSVGKFALFLVILTVGLTSPLLTVLSTMLLPSAAADPVKSSQIISLLAGKWGTSVLQTEVAISASALLVFASNTAIIGSYHVFMALSRMEFFPEWILRRNRLRGTPHFSIGISTLIPILILIIVHGNINILGDMYAFGLLGAFSLTCVSMDIVRYHARRKRQRIAMQNPKLDREQQEQLIAQEEGHEDQQDLQMIKSDGKASPTSSHTEEETDAEKPEPEGRWTRSSVNFYLGIFTTLLVLIAWSTNLVAKPLATIFGGSVSVLGMLIAYLNYARHKKKGRVPVITTGVEGDFPTDILAVLSMESSNNEAVINAALHNPDKKPVIFLYLGQQNLEQKPELFRLMEPHLNDPQAKDILARANHLAEEEKIDCRFIYRHDDPEAAMQVWKALHPSETILDANQAKILRHLPSSRTYEEPASSGKVLHILN